LCDVDKDTKPFSTTSSKDSGLVFLGVVAETLLLGGFFELAIDK